MRAAVLLVLGLIGLAAGAGKVRKLAGINGYISDHPDERCEKIGDFLLHPYNRCSYLVCDYGYEPWKDDYGRTKLFARIMPCAPGTAVPSSAYKQGQHKLDPTKVCTQHYGGKCPARVQSYHGNFYGSSHYAPRYSSHDSYDSYRPSSGYGLKGSYGYEEPSHSSGYHKKNSYGDDTYGSSYRTRSSYAPSRSHGHSSSSSSGSSRGSSYGRPSSSSSHSSSYGRPSSRGRYSSRGQGGHQARPRYGRRPPRGYRVRPSHHRRPSIRPSYRRRRTHSHHGSQPSHIGPKYDAYGFSHSPHLSFKKGATVIKAKTEPSKESYSPSSYSREQSSSNSQPSQSSYSRYPRQATSYSSRKPSYQGMSYRKDSYPRKSSYSSKSQDYPSKEQYQNKDSSSYGSKESYPNKPVYPTPSYAKAPNGIKYPSIPETFKYPSPPKGLRYPSIPENLQYPQTPAEFSQGGYQQRQNSHRGPQRGSSHGGHHRVPHGRRTQLSSYKPKSSQHQDRYQSARPRPQYPATPPVRPQSQYQQNSYQRSSNKGTGYSQNQGYQGGSSYQRGSYQGGNKPQKRRQRPYPTGEPSSQQGGYGSQQY